MPANYSEETHFNFLIRVRRVVSSHLPTIIRDRSTHPNILFTIFIMKMSQSHHLTHVTYISNCAPKIHPFYYNYFLKQLLCFYLKRKKNNLWDIDDACNCDIKITLLVTTTVLAHQETHLFFFSFSFFLFSFAYATFKIMYSLNKFILFLASEFKHII